jgi:hypothetical protein
MFHDGYSEELAGRNPGRRRGVLDYAAFFLAVPAAVLFWSYVVSPIWSFTEEVVERFRTSQARMAEMKDMVGRCYSTPIGSVGAVLRHESGFTVKIGFASGITGVYPAESLAKADCPRG